MSQLFQELKRRNVFRVALAYLAAGWLVLQVVQLVLESTSAPDWVMQVFLLAIAVGFPFAVLFAWAFELTSEGLKREHEVDREKSITQQTGRKLNGAIIVVLAAAVAFLLVDKFVLQPDSAAPAAVTDTSIAVLPFVNMSSDPEQEYFSDGISEEILNVLAQVPDLHVTSRSSAFQFKGDDIDIPTVADQLGVRHILEGSVRKSGNSVRITAQLIEAKTDRHLWSQTYDRTLEDTFAVQDEVSAAIASAIGEALGFAYAEESSVRASIDPEAYNQYLLGVYNVERRTKDSVEAAIRDFERSIEIEPDYADAHARLAVAHLLLGFVADLNRNEQFEKAKPHAEKAYSLSPNSWEANMAMGRMLSARGALFGTDYDEAVPYMEKTLELNPSYGPAYAWMAELQSARGDYVGRHKILEAGIKVAPLDNALLYDIAHSYIYQDRFDEAQKIIDRLTTITPSWALNATATLATRQGRWADNAVALIHYLSLEPTRSNYWARRIVSEDLGLPEEALTIGDSDDRNLRVYVVLGRESEALERARSRYEEDPTLGNLWGLGDIQAYVGKLEAANSTFEEQMSQSENVDLYEPTTTWIAAKVAVGNMEDARELVRQLDERIEQRRRGGIDVAPDYLGLGYAHYLIGNRERGLAELERTVRLGFYVPTFQAYLEELRNDPEFAPLLAAQRQKQKEQQEIFLTIMCGPDNPIPDFWKPSDAACDSLSEQAID